MIASRLHVKDHQPAPSSVSWLYKTLNQQQIIGNNKSNSLGFWNMPTSRLHNMQYIKRVGCSDIVSLSLQADICGLGFYTGYFVTHDLFNEIVRPLNY